MTNAVGGGVDASTHPTLAPQHIQAAMQAGLDVFAIDSPEHKELKDVERDLNLMEQVRYDHTPSNGSARSLVDYPASHSITSTDRVARLNFFLTAPAGRNTTQEMHVETSILHIPEVLNIKIPASSAAGTCHMPSTIA